MGTGITLRPEVQAFAEEMERLLAEHDAELGDSYKQETPNDLILSMYRRAALLHAVVDASMDREQVLRNAASLGAHAMFVAVVVAEFYPPYEKLEPKS